MIVLVMIIRNR